MKAEMTTDLHSSFSCMKTHPVIEKFRGHAATEYESGVINDLFSNLIDHYCIFQSLVVN